MNYGRVVSNIALNLSADQMTVVYQNETKSLTTSCSSYAIKSINRSAIDKWIFKDIVRIAKSDVQIAIKIVQYVVNFYCYRVFYDYVSVVNAYYLHI